MSNDIYPDNMPGRTWPRRRTPVWKTHIDTTPSGREWRSTTQTVPRYRYALQYAFLRSKAALPEYQTLFGFANKHLGAFDTFLFRDPDDRTVTAGVFAIGDAATTQFGLLRTHGGFAERVFDLDGAPSIYADGVLLSSGYTVGATGVVTFSAAPASGVVLTWSGNFFWRCRFDGDELTFEQFMAGFWKTGEVKLITVKP